MSIGSAAVIVQYTIFIVDGIPIVFTLLNIEEKSSIRICPKERKLSQQGDLSFLLIHHTSKEGRNSSSSLRP